MRRAGTDPGWLFITLLLAFLLAGVAMFASQSAVQPNTEERAMQEEREWRRHAPRELLLAGSPLSHDGIAAFGERGSQVLVPRAKPFSSKLPSWISPLALNALWPLSMAPLSIPLRALPTPITRFAFDLPRAASPPAPASESASTRQPRGER